MSVFDPESQRRAEELAHQQERFDIHVMAFADHSPAVAEALQRAFAIDARTAEQLLSETPLVVKRSATPDVAAALFDMLAELGAQVVILPAAPASAAPRSGAPGSAPAAPRSAASTAPTRVPAPASASSAADAWGGLDLEPIAEKRMSEPERLRRSEPTPLEADPDFAAARESSLSALAVARVRDDATGGFRLAPPPPSESWAPAPRERDSVAPRRHSEPSEALEFELDGEPEPDPDALALRPAPGSREIDLEPAATAELELGAQAMPPALDLPELDPELDAQAELPMLGEPDAEADLIETAEPPPLSQLLSLLPQRPNTLEGSARPPPVPPLARAPARGRSTSDRSGLERAALPQLPSLGPPPVPPPPPAAARPLSLDRHSATPSARSRELDPRAVPALPDLELAFRRQPGAGAARPRARAESTPPRASERPAAARVPARVAHPAEARQSSPVPSLGPQSRKPGVAVKPLPTRARGLALAELLGGMLVLYLGFRFDDSIFHGEASLASIALHGFAFYALGAGVLGLRP